MRLIRDRRKRMHLSYDRAGQLIPGRPISGTRWRQLEDGSRAVRDVGRIPESAPPVTLAGMAYVVGATPAELHAEGCHEAADELIHLTEQRARQDGTTLAEANRMAATVRGLNARQQQALAQEIAQGLRRVREQGR
jgi:methyl-accepting chemotaxis protein